MSKLKRSFADPTVDPPDQAETEQPEAQPQGMRVIKGFGVPERTRQAGSSKYDIASLEVGDAFVSTVAKDVRNVTVAARAYSRRVERNGGPAPKFVTRKLADGQHALIRES